MTLPFPGVPLSEQADWLREAEDLGYTDFWTSETAEYDAFTPLAVAAPLTGRARLGTAIAGALSRGPMLLAMQAAALADAAPGRFVLGIGASSPLPVEGWNASRFERPLASMRDRLRFLRRALAGERIDERFETFRVEGAKLERPPRVAPPIHLAALREGMLRLAAAEADGVLLGLVAAEDLAPVREALGPRAGDDAFEIGIRLGVIPSEDEDRARDGARRLVAAYLNAPPYAALHRWLGRAEELQPLWNAWREGDRRRALAAVPDALVDALFIHGSVGRCRERVEEFAAGGVSLPILQVMPFGGDPREALRGLAPG